MSHVAAVVLHARVIFIHRVLSSREWQTMRTSSAGICSNPTNPSNPLVVTKLSVGPYKDLNDLVVFKRNRLAVFLWLEQIPSAALLDFTASAKSPVTCVYGHKMHLLFFSVGPDIEECIMSRVPSLKQCLKAWGRKSHRFSFDNLWLHSHPEVECSRADKKPFWQFFVMNAIQGDF